MTPVLEVEEDYGSLIITNLLLSGFAGLPWKGRTVDICNIGHADEYRNFMREIILVAKEAFNA